MRHCGIGVNKLRQKRQSIVKEEKRQLIINAAIKVFADKGYYRCRVADIAKEAGIAYGLIYHYFESKEDLLNSIFIEKWGVFIRIIESIIEQESTLRGRLYGISSFLLESYLNIPELMEVFILEIARSPKFLEEKNLKAFSTAFLLVEKIFDEARERGEVKEAVDSQLAAYMFFGAIETILTGYVFKLLSYSDKKHFEEKKDKVVDIFLTGIIAG
jgi:TetR/AcrR family transcriptional regulator, fatty acid metabolism regulator protein